MAPRSREDPPSSAPAGAWAEERAWTEPLDEFFSKNERPLRGLVRRERAQAQYDELEAAAEAIAPHLLRPSPITLLPHTPYPTHPTHAPYPHTLPTHPTQTPYPHTLPTHPTHTHRNPPTTPSAAVRREAEHPMVRHEAAEALGAVGSLEAVDLLRLEPKRHALRKTCSQKNMLKKKARRAAVWSSPSPHAPFFAERKKTESQKSKRQNMLTELSHLVLPILSHSSRPFPLHLPYPHFFRICHRHMLFPLPPREYSKHPEPILRDSCLVALHMYDRAAFLAAGVCV